MLCEQDAEACPRCATRLPDVVMLVSDRPRGKRVPAPRRPETHSQPRGPRGGRTSPIGFRLAHELEGILLGIKADAVINEHETGRLRRWLTANQPFTGQRPFSELAEHVEHALADGRLSEDECDDLLYVVSKFTTVNPHFDQLRGGLQVLMGVLAGVAADHVINDAEAAALGEWLASWAHLRGLWPYDECDALVTSILANRRVGDEEAFLLALTQQFPIGDIDHAGTAPPPLIQGVCAATPEITFSDRWFVITGDSARAPRREMEDVVVSIGGYAHPRVTTDVDYLIVCAEGSPLWSFSCYGRKVERAYELRREGHKIQIVHENDFWDAVQDSAAGV